MRIFLRLTFFILISFNCISISAQKRIVNKYLLTGKVHESYTVNSQGDLHGIYEAYDPNGALLVKLNYKNGAKCGWCEFYTPINGTSRLFKKALFFINEHGGREFNYPDYPDYAVPVSLAGQISHYIQYAYADGQRYIKEEYYYGDNKRELIYHEILGEDRKPLVILNRKKGEFNFEYSENKKEVTEFTDQKGIPLDTIPTYQVGTHELIRRMYIDSETKNTHYIFTDYTGSGEEQALTKYTDKEILSREDYKWKIKEYNTKGNLIEELEYHQRPYKNNNNFIEYASYKRTYRRGGDQFEHFYNPDQHLIQVSKNGHLYREYQLRPQDEDNDSYIYGIAMREDSLDFMEHIPGKVITLKTFDSKGNLISLHKVEMEKDYNLNLSTYKRLYSLYIDKYNNHADTIRAIVQRATPRKIDYSPYTFFKNRSSFEFVCSLNLLEEFVPETSTSREILRKIELTENKLLKELKKPEKEPALWTYYYQNGEITDIAIEFLKYNMDAQRIILALNFDKNSNLREAKIFNSNQATSLSKEQIQLFNDYVGFINTILNNYEKALSYQVEKKNVTEIVKSNFNNDHDLFKKELIKCYPRSERKDIESRLNILYPSLEVTELDDYTAGFDAYMELREIMKKASELSPKYNFI